MANQYQEYCDNLYLLLHSDKVIPQDILWTMNREILNTLARQLNIPVQNVRKLSKPQLCEIIATYITPVKQRGGYFDPVLNQQIDDDIQQGADFADDLYDYDANDIDDEDIEDDDDLDDEEYED